MAETLADVADLVEAVKPIVAGLAMIYHLCIEQGLPEEIAVAYVGHIIWTMSQ